MPSNKPKINSYISEDELAALDAMCKENELSRSQGVAHLIRNHLIEDDESAEVKEIEGGYEDRLKRVETANGSLHDFRFKQACINEKADRLIAELQEEVSRLKEKLKDKPVEVVTDDQIAAATGQPEWKVKLWRHGVQKPRGIRIKAKLEPFKVLQGQWVKR